MFSFKEGCYKNYILSFRDFKQVFHRANFIFENKVKEWLTFDRNLKKDYCKIWESFVLKFTGNTNEFPILSNFPNLEEIFEELIPDKLEIEEVSKNTSLSNLKI